MPMLLHAAVFLLSRERKARLIAGNAKTNHRGGALRWKMEVLMHLHASTRNPHTMQLTLTRLLPPSAVEAVTSMATS